MKTLIDAAELLNRLTGAFESAQVFQGCDQKNLDDFERLWKPELISRRSEFTTWQESAEANAQDSHWDWIRKARAANDSLQYEFFTVECGDTTQGLMLVDVTKFANLPTQEGRELVYVDFLATAPWNRPGFSQAPKYKGIGRLLIATAVSLSLTLEFKGRIGLHSLPQSENWYETVCGFTASGYDQEKKLKYFEMTEIQAACFLTEEGR